jgi:hypothetical protein
MSFSFHDFHDVISDAISHAANEKVLLFGAASNYSHNFSNRVGFPARLGPVICIRSNTWEGIKSNFSPDGQAMSMNFSIIGEALKAATTQRRRDDPEEKRENGTSCATPIAAGVAALILEFARITEKPGVFYHERLKLLPGMRAVIADCMTDKDVSQGSYRYIKPWLLFGGHNGKKMDTNKISWEIDLALTNST